MGGQISLQSKIDENKLLKKFIGLQPITDNDPFWNQLVAFNYHLDETNRSTRLAFDQQCVDLLETLMYNTATTGNFAALVRVFLRRANELNISALTNDRIFQWQTSNCLLIIRYCCKFFAERLTEVEYIKTFSRQIMSKDGHVIEKRDDATSDFHFENTCEEFIYTLVHLIIELKPDDVNLPVLVESIRTLILLLSAQLYKEHACCAKLKIVQCIMNKTVSSHAPAFCRALLHNYAIGGVDKSITSVDSDQSGSLVLGLANSFWSSLSWAVTDDSNRDQDELISHPCARTDASLSNLSLLLLVALCCHSAKENAINGEHSDENFDDDEDEKLDKNKNRKDSSIDRDLNRYRVAVATFGNEQELSAVGNQSISFVFDYSALYSRICATVNQEVPMLLLYILLHSNMSFRNFVLSRIDLEKLVVPVLQVLHASQSDDEKQKPASNEHHMYLALVVLLMLTEDDFYCKIVHETTITNVDWYNSERTISSITLGGLIVLVLTRTIQMNIVKVRDRYLHTNSLAALSNMSTYFKGLSAIVSQKLVGLLEALNRRHQRLVQSINQSVRFDTEQATTHMHLLQQDVTAFEEAIRTLLEIINRTLTHQLRANAHLVYTMLYKRQLFEQLHEQPLFHDLGWNIAAVLNHFSARVQTLGAQATVAQVLDNIEAGALQWPSDRLKKFPDVTFRYVEDENTDEFFVPYVWKLIYRHSTLHWHASSVKLFNAHELA